MLQQTMDGVQTPANMYDLIVIGGGPGGYLAAERAAHGGLKTLLIEKRALGGVCLNEGCIPSKAMLNSAKLYEHALHATAYGVQCDDVRIDQKAVMKRKTKVVRTLVAGVRGKMRNAGVTVVTAAARIDGKDGEHFRVQAEDNVYLAKQLILATGSSNVIPPLPGIRENLGDFVLTNREVLELQQIPGRLVIIGGGVIGLEMACYYNAVGSQVTVIEMLDHIAGPTDREISAMLQKQLEQKGITFLLQHRVKAVEPGSVTAENAEGQTITVDADKVLLSIGRRANCEGLGLETIGVVCNRGIVTDGQCRTNVPGVFAVGDVNGHNMLAHTAYREAEVAVNTILGREDVMKYEANPAVIYTQPEIAAVGKTEEQCRAEGMDYEAAKLSMRYSGRFVAENEGADGLCKILIDRKTRAIVGVHLIGAYSGEIIWGAAAMIETKMPIADARKIIFPHPTVSEIIREVLWEFPD